MNNSNINSTLMQKYYPKDFSDLYLPERIQNLIDKNKNRKGYRLLLYGPAGTGKTSTARLLNPKYKYEVLFKSGSNDFNIETMRNSIYPFIQSHSTVLGKTKTLIIDECERMSEKIQDAFKVVLDKSVNINFIFITNDIEKLTPYIKSRFDLIEFNYTEEELKIQKLNYINHIIKVCKNENIKYDNDGIKELFIKNFPDFRHILRVLQQFIDTGKEVNLQNVRGMIESSLKNLELYQLLEIQDPQKFYFEATKWKGRERECLASLGEPYFEYLNEQNKFDKTLKAAVIVAKYSNMYVNTFNKFVCFFSCLTELKNLN